MAKKSNDLEVIPGKEFKRVADALRYVDASLPAKLRKQLKEAAKPLVVAAKENAKSIPVAHEGKAVLRRMVAAGVGVQVSTGRRAALRIVTKMPKANMAIIPRGLESSKGWRHPVFGRDTWVFQGPQNDWFMSAMQDGKAETMARINKVLKEGAEFVAAHGSKKP